MDLMQTMPAFVWLVPVVTLFGIGVVPGVVATIIFALPPGVRLTELGIRNVDAEIVEAAQRLRRHAAADPVRRPAAAGAADHHGRRQPGHHAGSVDGGHRRSGRRRRASAVR